MPKYIKKRIVVDAICWTGYPACLKGIPGGYETFSESGAISRSLDDPLHSIQINSLEGVMIAKVGDWIVRGPFGEFYPIKAEIFEDTYEPI